MKLNKIARAWGTHHERAPLSEYTDWERRKKSLTPPSDPPFELLHLVEHRCGLLLKNRKLVKLIGGAGYGGRKVGDPAEAVLLELGPTTA
jgi:hypothetical protein